MPTMRLPPHLVLFLMAVVLTTASNVTLTTDDELCFYTSTPPHADTPLRTCRMCLNADLATPTCFLDSRGLCLAMSSYNPNRTDGVQQFIAANNTYCSASDAVCNACIADPSTGNVCTGQDGQCICLMACESASWEANIKSIVQDAAVAVDVPTTTTVPVETTTHKSHSPAIVLIAALVIILLLGVDAVRRRLRKKQVPGFYNMAVTPKADLLTKIRV